MTTLICPTCKQEIADDSVFCKYCGTKITAARKPHARGGVLDFAVDAVPEQDEAEIYEETVPDQRQTDPLSGAGESEEAEPIQGQDPYPAPADQAGLQFEGLDLSRRIVNQTFEEISRDTVEIPFADIMKDGSSRNYVDNLADTGDLAYVDPPRQDRDGLPFQEVAQDTSDLNLDLDEGFLDTVDLPVDELPRENTEPVPNEEVLPTDASFDTEDLPDGEIPANEEDAQEAYPPYEDGSMDTEELPYTEDSESRINRPYEKINSDTEDLPAEELNAADLTQAEEVEEEEEDEEAVRRRPLGRGLVWGLVVVALVVAAVLGGMYFYSESPAVKNRQAMETASSLMDLARYEDAIAAYQQILQEDPTNEEAAAAISQAYLNRVRELTGAGSYEAAGATLQTAIGAVSDNSALLAYSNDLYTAWNQSCLDEGKYEEGLAVLQKARELYPEQSSFAQAELADYQAWADALIGQENYTQAADVLTRGIEAYDDDALKQTLVSLHLKQAEASTGQEAIAAWEQVITDDPGNVEAYQKLAEQSIAAGSSQDALDWIRKGIDQTQNDQLKSLLLETLQTAAENAQGEAKVAAWQEVLKEDGKNAAAYLALADYYSSAGDNDTALSTLQQGIDAGAGDSLKTRYDEIVKAQKLAKIEALAQTSRKTVIDSKNLYLRETIDQLLFIGHTVNVAGGGSVNTESAWDGSSRVVIDGLVTAQLNPEDRGKAYKDCRIYSLQATINDINSKGYIRVAFPGGTQLGNVYKDVRNTLGAPAVSKDVLDKSAPYRQCYYPDASDSSRGLLVSFLLKKDPDDPDDYDPGICITMYYGPHNAQ